MALTQANCEMIKAIAENNMALARKKALESCVEDGTKKNAWFAQQYEKILSSSYTAEILDNIPANLKWKIVGDLPENFRKEQYYLSEREKAVFEKIYRMKVVAQKMQELGISYRNTTLLYGESGTGKTMFGKYVAHRLQLPYFYLNFSQMVDSYLGGTASNIHNAFSYIKNLPCVFMIDEIDCIASHRSGRGGKGPDGEIERTTISIMQEMDTLPNSVVLIGATNRKDLIDEALMRRFSIIHEVKPLTKEEAAAMAKLFLDDINKKLSGQQCQIKMPEAETDAIIEKEKTPARIMNEITQRVGKKLYEATAKSIPENPWAEEDRIADEKTPVYEVTFSQTYKVTTREGKEEAVKKARSLRMTSNSYQGKNTPEEKVEVTRV